MEDVSKELQRIIDEEIAEKERQIKLQVEELKQLDEELKWQAEELKRRDEEIKRQAEELKEDEEVIKKLIMLLTGIPLKTVMDTIGIPATEQSGYNALI